MNDNNNDFSFYKELFSRKIKEALLRVAKKDYSGLPVGIIKRGRFFQTLAFFGLKKEEAKLVLKILEEEGFLKNNHLGIRILKKGIDDG
jgi:hypothetical protein